MPSADPDWDSLTAPYAGQRVVVTGGLGFIGSNLALRLAAAGAEVTVIDALIADHGGNPENLVGAAAPIRVLPLDLRETEGLAEALAGAHTVFNLAGQVSHLDSMREPVADLSHNVLAHVVLLEACRAAAPDAVVVFASTRQFYGRPDYLPVDERHPVRPVDVNGINKWAGEAYHTLYHQVHGMKTVALRLSNVYGPRLRIADARQTFLGLWLRLALDDQPVEVWGGQQTRDLAYVDDALSAFLLAGRTPALYGGAFNLGGSPPIRLIDLARLVIRLAGSGSVVVREFPAERLRIDIGDYYADDRLFRDLTGWHPTVSIEQGLRRSLDYFRSRLDAYR